MRSGSTLPITTRRIYLLTAAAALPMPELVVIKTISVPFDLLLAQAMFYLPVVLAADRHRQARSLAILVAVPLVFLIMLAPVASTVSLGQSSADQ